ncbi:nucleoside hydrolase [Nocardia sp. NPDC004068]|uniref:nucleoside hydrolase n=1 Tax=Nocardia sp. NPDC004068 TaxID=3364303 RepID=UPI0036BDFB49
MATPVDKLDHRSRRPEPDEDGLVVLNTDIAYDPDNFVAMVIAARLVPVGQLAVVTSDEVGGLRARFARRVLDAMGRGEVPVIEGIDLGGTRRYLPDPGQRIPDYIRPLPDENEDRRHRMTDALLHLVASARGPVRWVGCGPMSELAVLFTTAPEYADQLIVTQMGGWLTGYRNPARASHNFATDVGSAGLALRVLPRPRLVLSDHTNHPAIRVTEDWELIHTLAADSAPDWARWLSTHFHRWFTRKGGSWMHDPLTLSAALGYPFVRFADELIDIGDDARLYRDPCGRPMQVSTDVAYEPFLEWMQSVVLSW